MCKYGEYGICSICPQDECPENEIKINKLKQELLKDLRNIFFKVTNISLTHSESEKIINYIKSNKEKIIQKINEL